MKITLYILILIILNSALMADLRVDYSILKNNSGKSLYLSYSISSNDFKNIKLSENYLIEANVKLNLTNDLNDSLVIIDSLKAVVSNDFNNMTIIGSVNVELDKENYKATLELSDKNSDEILTKQISIRSKNLSEAYSISDPIISYKTENIDSSTIQWENRFKLNNYYVLPNPSLEFTSQNSKLFFYSEIYNNELNFDSVGLKYRLLNSNKGIVRDTSFTIKLDSITEISNFSDLSTLSTGIYYLQLELFEKEDGRIINKSNQKKFFLINNIAPALKARFTENQEFDMSEFATMDEEAIEIEFDKVRNILSKYESEQYEQLDLLKAKQRAIFSYWKYRDTDTNTRINERRVEFEKAVRFANKHFKYVNNNQGWRTDRGRVILKYGFPDERENFEEKEGKNACEIWYYGQIRGGVFFYFVDTNNYGDYFLVHSTMINEIYDSQWMQRYNPAIDATQNMELKNSLDNEKEEY